MTDLFGEVRRCIEAEEAVAVATVIEIGESAVGVLAEAVSGPRLGSRMLVFPDENTHGGFWDDALQGRVVADAVRQLRAGVPKAVTYDGPARELVVFIDVYPAPNRLLVFGGVHIAVPLVELAKSMGFRVVVIDARGRFATRERFPRADDIVESYAEEYLRDARLDESTYVVVLSHDPKLDDPALIGALASNVRYVGAIGSRKTHAARVERLREAGLTDDRIRRIHAPIGLDIDARNPEEIALAIMAEMIAVKNGASSDGSSKGSGKGSGQATPVARTGGTSPKPLAAPAGA